MELIRLAGGDENCQEGNCPTVYETRRGTIVVQGDIFDKKTPVGEGAVEIPLSGMEEAVRALGR